MADKDLREEVAELAGAVRELRDREVADTLRDLRAEVEKLRAERDAHHCHGHALCCSHAHCNWGHCGCFTVHYNYSTFGAAGGAYPLTYTVTNDSTNISMAPWVTTNVAAGASTTLSISNLVTRSPRPAHIPMLEVPFGQNVSPEPRPASSDEAVKAFIAYGEPAGLLDPSVITETEVQALLSAVAAALNACERARITVKLAHGAVLTNAGYVLPVYPEAGERFAVRTMALTEFSAQAGSEDED